MAVVLEILFFAFIEIIVYLVMYSTGAILIRVLSLNKLKPSLNFDKNKPKKLNAFDWFYLCVLTGAIFWVLIIFIFG